MCPKCQGSFTFSGDRLGCPACDLKFPVEKQLPLLYWDPAKEQDITSRVRSFYESHPFPDYSEFDDLAGLLERVREGVLARLLDEQIPFGSRILECGCGTGQLSNVLGIAHRTVIGTDLSTSSLRLAENFRNRHTLERVFFLQMNLFNPVFPESSFDFVICNGVLHHTADPRLGFKVLSRLVRPGGYLIIGLHHRFGRIMTGIRRGLFRVFGPRLSFLDPRIRKIPRGKGRREAWYEDQYRNPYESKHTISEVLGWLDNSGLDFVRSVPSDQFLTSLSDSEQLFEPTAPGGSIERSLKELSMLLTGDREGGFFTIISRRRP